MLELGTLCAIAIRKEIVKEVASFPIFDLNYPDIGIEFSLPQEIAVGVGLVERALSQNTAHNRSSLLASRAGKRRTVEGNIAVQRVDLDEDGAAIVLTPASNNRRHGVA